MARSHGHQGYQRLVLERMFQPNLIAPELLNGLNQFLFRNQPVPAQQQQVEVEQAAVEQNIPEVL